MNRANTMSGKVLLYVVTLPVFNIAITLKEKRQSFFYDPLKSLLSVQSLQRTKILKLQFRLVLLHFRSIRLNMYFHVRASFPYTNRVLAAYRSSSGRHCEVLGKKLWFAAVEDRPGRNKLSCSTRQFKEPRVAAVM